MLVSTQPRGIKDPRVSAPPTCGHEEGDAELAAEDASPQVLQRAAVEGEGAAHQHVEDHAQALQDHAAPQNAIRTYSNT